jgi:L-ascorbate 6-phosphate lactonase
MTRLVREIEKVEEGQTNLWFLGGPSVAIQTGGRIAYIDPFFGPSVNPVWNRRFEPMIDPAQIAKADYVLITHEHRDHCHETTIRAFEKKLRPKYFLPRFSLDTIRQEFGLRISSERVQVVRPGDRFAVEGMGVEVFPSSDVTAKEAVAYLLSLEGGKIFHAGDSLYVPSFFEALKTRQIDIALLPLGKNPPGWNVYPEEENFLKLASEIGARVSVPIHWDLWKESYIDARGLEKGITGTVIRVISRGSKLSLPLDAKDDCRPRRVSPQSLSA